jgi:hypothetical protein
LGAAFSACSWKALPETDAAFFRCRSCREVILPFWEPSDLLFEQETMAGIKTAAKSISKNCFIDFPLSLFILC